MKPIHLTKLIEGKIELLLVDHDSYFINRAFVNKAKDPLLIAQKVMLEISEFGLHGHRRFQKHIILSQIKTDLGLIT